MTKPPFVYSSAPKRLLLSFLVLFATGAVLPQTLSAATKIRVKIEVQASNGLDQTIASYITKALRDIPDARITDSDPHVVISCVVESRTVSRTVIYALSFAVTDNLESRLLEQNIEDFLATEPQDAVTRRYAKSLQGLRDLSTLGYHSVTICSEDELPVRCSLLGGEVDEHVFKFVRDYLNILNSE